MHFRPFMTPVNLYLENWLYQVRYFMKDYQEENVSREYQSFYCTPFDFMDF